MSRQQRFRQWYERLTIWRAIFAIVVIEVIVVFTAGISMRIAEPKTFHNLGDSLWWSVVTISTVGYGDIAPVTGRGRAVASIFMVFSIAFIPAVTAIIVSLLLHHHSSKMDKMSSSDR